MENPQSRYSEVYILAKNATHSNNMQDLNVKNDVIPSINLFFLGKLQTSFLYVKLKNTLYNSLIIIIYE